MYSADVETICFGGDEGTDRLEPVTVTFDTETISVRELIEQAVTRQVHMMNARRVQNNASHHRRMQRQYLSDQDVEQLASEGRILFETRPEAQSLDLQTCVNAALEGFRRRRFFIAVNGTRPGNLDDEVVLMPDSRVQFVRLIPLVGG